MESQFKLFHGGTFQLPLEKPLSIGAAGGELAVVSGSVWLTRSGDPGDHVLGAGDRIRLQPRQQVVVEPWDRSEWPTLKWQPDAGEGLGQILWRGLRTAALRTLAWGATGSAAGLRRAGAGFEALARSAASSASRAQGCI